MPEEALAAEHKVETVRDALKQCEDLVSEQIEKAVEQRAPPNTAITGDAIARAKILLLLPNEQKRELFLKILRRTEAWQRVKPLFGSPPFTFLHPEDAGMLRAAGFAKNRVNMAYEFSGTTANIGQFGPGQLEDESNREYNVSLRNSKLDDPLPGGNYFDFVSGDLLLNVKISKRSALEKKKLLLDSLRKKALFFPQPGERVMVQETQHLLKARGLRKPTQTSLVVKALLPRALGSSTASVLVSIV